MRILGFSKKWHKLEQDEFTTFRFSRKDKDWWIGEQVKVVYKPRRKGGGEFMGVAEIKSKEPRWVKPEIEKDIPQVTDQEALLDGFQDKGTMMLWMAKTYGLAKIAFYPMNKLTVKWIQKGGLTND